MVKTILRLCPKDQTQAEIFIDGSLAATIPMWELEQLVDEKKKIEARKPGPDVVVMANEGKINGKPQFKASPA